MRFAQRGATLLCPTLCGCFGAHRRLRRRHRFAERKGIGLRRYPVLDAANDEVKCGHRCESVLITQAIDEALLSQTQHLLRQRGEVAEHPDQICTLLEGESNEARADRRVNLQNAISEFVYPHASLSRGR